MIKTYNDNAVTYGDVNYDYNGNAVLVALVYSVKIDDNRQYVAIAENDDKSGINTIKCDHITGRVLADIVFGESGRTKETKIKNDQNYEWVATAVDASGNIIPLQMDSNQNLACDLTFEI